MAVPLAGWGSAYRWWVSMLLAKSFPLYRKNKCKGGAAGGERETESGKEVADFQSGKTIGLRTRVLNRWKVESRLPVQPKPEK